MWGCDMVTMMMVMVMVVMVTVMVIMVMIMIHRNNPTKHHISNLLRKISPKMPLTTKS